MKSSEIRNWLGLYVLGMCVALAFCFTALPETPLLPISRSDGMAALQIIIPTLFAQLALVYRWQAGKESKSKESESQESTSKDTEVMIEPWVVKGPPIAVVSLIVAAIVQMAWGNLAGKTWTIPPSTFRFILSFCVGLLNGSSVLVLSKYFQITATRS